MSALAGPYCIRHGKKFRIADFDPADTQDFDLKDKAEKHLKASVARLSEMQQKLYAQDRWALLIILQGMDSAGKDSVIRHVMTGVNPEGCQVVSFKAPSAEDLSHDFLWRTSKSLPQRGHIGIFNRSYYEEVLVARVHPQTLDKELLPERLVTKRIWKDRFEDINAFEKYLARNGIIIRKIFLNVSKDEQKKRFLDRLEEPDKNWKFSEDDVREREHWKDYRRAYEDMIRHTSSPKAPWYVVPADHKWFAQLVTAAIITETLKSLHLAFPKPDAAKKKELASARNRLVHEA